MNEGLNLHAAVVDDPTLWHDARGGADVLMACREFLELRGDRSNEELRYATARHYRDKAKAKHGRAGK